MAELGDIGKLLGVKKSALITPLISISGVYLRDGLPAFGRIYAISRSEFSLAGTTISDPATGEWFMLVPNILIIIIALDDREQYNAQVFDRVMPV